MVSSINLYEQTETTISLNLGKYDIYLSGGYKISIGNNFRLTITNSKTLETIQLKKVIHFRSYIKGLRVVKIFSIEIPEYADYIITLAGQDEVAVKNSMLSLLNLIEKSPKKSDINLIISNE